MEWQLPEGMDEYLHPTEMCDSKNPAIREKARELIKNAKTPKEAALRIFSYVRDQIPFLARGSGQFLGPAQIYGVKASDTLQNGYGFCVTKAHLQIALLRAVRIPARYHLAVLDKNILNGPVEPSVLKNFPDHPDNPSTIWYHPWCECYLSGNWISCDTLFDKALLDIAYKKGWISKEQIPIADWDGETDLNTASAWMIEDKGTFASLDDFLKKTQEEFFSENK